MTLPKHIPALDGLRGLAVTLVIASHAFPMVPELPWAVKRFSNLGFYGVQLFFVVSAVTLAHSWRRSEARGKVSLRGFALRRVFRIAPAYVLAALGYLWLLRPPLPDATRVLTFLTFTNGWTPAQMPTVPGTWIGVPGGWSIEAEFAFYALFPVLIVLLRGLWRALAGLVLSLPLAWALNAAGSAAYLPVYGDTATDQFLYYWLPNQVPVFLCGLVAYELVVACRPGAPATRRIGAAAPALLASCALVFGALAFVPWPRLPRPDHAFLPAHLVAALAFAGAVVVLAARPLAPFVHRWTVALGQVSFSAYLTHFAIIAGLEWLLPPAVFATTGAAAAAASVALFLVVLGLTAAVSQLTYRVVELPMIRLGAAAIRSTGPAPTPA